MDLSSARAVITGGASGLGLATAERVVAAGGNVTLLDINAEQGAESAAKLGAQASFVQTDVASEENVQAAVREAHDTMGSVTLAVNCAGVIGAARALGREGPMAGDFFARTIAINLIGSFLVAKESANLMQENPPNSDGERGVIVSTASIAAFRGPNWAGGVLRVQRRCRRHDVAASERASAGRHSSKHGCARYLPHADGCRYVGRAPRITWTTGAVSPAPRPTGRICRYGCLYLREPDGER